MANALTAIGKERNKKKAEIPKKNGNALIAIGKEREARLEPKNKGGLAGGTAYTLGRIGVDLMAPVEGITDVLAATGDLIVGNPQKAKQRFTNSYTGEWREGLDEWYNPGKGMQVVGDIAGGVGQSVGYGLISAIPYAGMPLMYGSIASQGVSSAAQKTGNLGLREVGYGLSTGLVEGLLETYLGAGVKGAKTLGSSILKKTGKDVVKSAAKEAGRGAVRTIAAETAKSFAGEFAEEAISEAVDPALQRWFGIDKEARADIGSILYAGVIGGISGGIVGAGTSGINYASAVSAGRYLQENGLDGDLIKRAKSTLSGFEIANERAEAMKVEKPTGDVKETKEEKKTRKEANKASKAISKTTKNLGAKIENNIKAYEQMRADPAKANSNAAAAVLGELRGNLFLLGESFEIDTVEAFMKDSSDVERQAFVDAANEMMASEGNTESYTLADFDENKNNIRRRLAGQLTFEKAAEELLRRRGTTDAAESPTEASGEAQDLWAGIAEDADFEALGATSEAERALMQAARIQGVPNASVGEMLNQFRKGTALTPAEFADGWADGTQNYGRFGFDTKDADGTAFGRMETEAREAAMKYGRESAEAETRKREEAAKAKKKPAEQAGKKGEVVRGEGLNIQKLSDEQYSAYKASEVLAEVLGTDIVLETNIELNGKPVNGYYSRKTNRLHVNINARRDGKSIAIYTLGHEVTHYIKEWSPAKFKVLQDFVMKQLGVDAETAIAEKMASLKRLGIITDTMTVAEANDIAVEEVVADGMELILTDGRVLEELAHTDKSLWEKVRDWFFDIIGQIRRSWESLNKASKTARVLKETMDSLDEIERLFTEGAKEAGERTRKAGVETETIFESDIKYSLAPNAKEEVKKALKDKNYRDEILLTDSTPKLLLGNKGIRDLPLTMNASHIRENIFTESEAQNNGFRVGKGINYHGLGEELFFKVIEDLENATEVYRGTKNAEKPERRENYFLLISQHQDKDGNVINVPVYINERSRHNRIFIDANKIATVFGRDNLRDYIQREVAKGNLVRVKTKRGSTQASEGASPIEADYSKDASNGSIPQIEDSVNTSAENSSENSSDNLYSIDDPAENADVSGNEAERLFTEGTREAGERARAAGVETVTRMNGEKMHVNDKVYSNGEINNRTFTYNELVTKGDLMGVVIDKNQQVPLLADGNIDVQAVLKTVRSKCESVGMKGGATTYYVNVPDIGRSVKMTREGITHGFGAKRNGRHTKNSKTTARATLELPNILKNSIEVNRLKSRGEEGILFSHVMMGTVAMEEPNGNIEYYAVRTVVEERSDNEAFLVDFDIIGNLHAAKAKKVGLQDHQGITKVRNPSGTTDAYAYSIAHFLDDVKGVFKNTFSNDVYQTLGVQREQDDFANDLLYSIDDPAETADVSGNEAERLFTEGVREAGERARAAETGEVAQGEGENVYSFTPADFEKPITLRDIEILRSIGRKSINAFTSADIEKAQKWAYKFYKDQKLGTKSPFFRAWFGDWRAYDKTPLEVADIPEYVATNEARKQQRGVVQNRDTKWDIRISREGETNTISHAGADRRSEYGLAGIQSLIKNAVLLDSEVHEHHSNNAKDDRITFDHKLYALGRDTSGGIALYKITVEEQYANYKDPHDKRFHNLKYIEKVADGIGSLTHSQSRGAESTNDASTTIYSIADLFAFVKQYDKEFSPKPVNKLMLNEDGTPKVFYHGTNAEFTAFDARKSRVGAFGKGFYLSPSKANAGMYGSSKIIESYVALQNPYVVKDSLGLDYETLQQMQDDLGESQRITDKNAMAVLKKHNYDGIVVMNNGRIKEIVVYDPKKIKSATDNIGTFDGNNPDIRYSIDETAEPAETADVSENRDLTDRELLGMALEGAVQSEQEYAIVKEYREQASMLDLVEEKKKSYAKEASSLERQIKALRERMNEEGDPNGFIRKAMDEAIAKKRQAEAMRDEQEKILDDATRKLASLRAAKPFRELISREQRRAKAAERKAAKAVEQAEAKVERANERADKRIQKEKERLKEQAEMSAERKNITDRKRQVQRILNNLNTMLYHPTKAKHVPPLMQSLVDYALKRADPKQFGINRDNIRTMSELAADIEKMKRKVALTADEQEQLYEMESKYKILEADTLSVKRQAEALMTAFETWVEQTSDAEVVDENMLQGLRDTVKEIDEAPLHLMTLKSLEAVESLYTAIKYQVDHSNNLFATDKKLGKQEMGQEASAEVAKQKDSKLFTPKPGEWTKIARVREFIWENLKPLTAFEVIGSDKLMSLFRNILNGEDVWVTDVLEGKKVLDEAKKKYGYNKWDLTARKEVTTADGSTVSLTLGERMSLYAYMFRDQAEEHLSTGGFVLAPDAKTIGTLKGIKAYEAYLNDQSTYQMRKEDIAKMAEGLTQNQKDYARDVQKYLTSLGKKGNEVSLKLYGMEIFNETDYFPIKSSRDYLKVQAGKTGDPQIKNRGTFKETTPGANNPIVLEDFMQVTSEHINTMAVYHAFTLPMEDLLRVWNYKPVNYKTDENGNVLLNDNGLPIADNEKGVQYNSLKAEIAKKYGKKANDYILQLMRDLNGGARQDSATTILDKGLTAFKRSATMLSLSTIIQQPTSIFRAMAYVDAKYFKGAKFYDYETVKKYAPVAAIKQIGGHDTSTGARTVEYINSKEYENQKEKLAAAAKRKVAGGDPQARADYFGFLTEKADEVAWRYMFGACVNEQAAKLKKPASSEEVLKAAGERFADVVRRTQVYDSTLTRSEIMRSKSSAAKLVTAFGAEPATVISMLVDGIVKAERGDKSFFRKTAGAVAISIIINAMASSLIYAMRDDDEDENLLEKYTQSLTGEIIEGFNPLEYLPYARDVMSLFKGYDVERSDMTLIGNLFDQVEMITSSKRSFLDKLFGVSGAVSAFFGVPITNVYRDAKGIIKTAASFGDAEPVTGGGTGGAVVSGLKSQYNLIFKLFGAQEGNAYELYKAALRGDTAHYERVAARYETEKDAEMALRTELRDNDKRIAEAAKAKLDGELEVFESVIEQIEGEGHFDRNLIIRAVNNEVLAIKDAEKQAKVPKDESVDVEDEEDEIEVEALYTASDLTDAIDRGDNDDFADVYDYLLSFKMEQGKTEAQAKASIKSSVTSKYKKLYLEAWAKNNTVEMRRLLELLIKTGLYGNRNDTAKTVEKWVRDANK